MNEITPTERDALRVLATRWILSRAHPSMEAVQAGLPAAAVPSSLAADVTAREPFRTRALEDASYFLAGFKPFGFGLEVELVGPLSPQPSQSWTRVLAPLVLRLTWCLHMDGRDPDESATSLARVGVEDGRWVVIDVWTDAERETWHAQRRHGMRPSGG